MDIIKEVLKPKYNLAHFASELYPGMERIAGCAKFNNKLYGRQGRSFTDSELLKIKETILK